MLAARSVMAAASSAVARRGYATSGVVPKNAVWLGLDSSTQGIKAVAINNDLDIIYSRAVNYDKDLPHYKTSGGVHVSATEPGVVRQPTKMYVEALEHLLDDMRGDGFSFELVEGVSGAGQQHGSCYWKEGAGEWMAGEGAESDGRSSLADAVGEWLAVPDSPIWMDSATSAECAAMHDAVGGAGALAHSTGSRAYERFTGPQIARMASTQPAAMAECGRIALVSSFMCSVLAGSYAGIDYSDGSGMNMMDLRSKDWNAAALEAVATASGKAIGPEPLRSLLGTPVSPAHIVGAPWRRLQAKYGLRPDCAIVTWTGDNPSSVAGLRLSHPGDIAISLGTSDTLFGITDTPTPGLDGHIFVSPCDDSAFMTMLCFKNGSLTRERVLDEIVAAGTSDVRARASDRFAWLEQQLLAAPGPSGNTALFVDHPEITPEFAPGDYIADSSGSFVVPPGEGVAAAIKAGQDPAALACALVQGQVLNMFAHATILGVRSPKRILLTGGASRNRGIQRTIANVFGAPVSVAATPDTAALGAAFRARHAVLRARSGKDSLPFDKIGPLPDLPSSCEPDPSVHAAYSAHMPDFERFVTNVLASKGHTA